MGQPHLNDYPSFDLKRTLVNVIERITVPMQWLEGDTVEDTWECLNAGEDSTEEECCAMVCFCHGFSCQEQAKSYLADFCILSHNGKDNNT